MKKNKKTNYKNIYKIALFLLICTIFYKEKVNIQKELKQIKQELSKTTNILSDIATISRAFIIIKTDKEKKCLMTKLEEEIKKNFFVKIENSKEETNNITNIIRCDDTIEIETKELSSGNPEEKKTTKYDLIEEIDKNSFNNNIFVEILKEMEYNKYYNFAIKEKNKIKLIKTKAHLIKREYVEKNNVKKIIFKKDENFFLQKKIKCNSILEIDIKMEDENENTIYQEKSLKLKFRDKNITKYLQDDILRLKTNEEVLFFITKKDIEKIILEIDDKNLISRIKDKNIIFLTIKIKDVIY